MKIVILDGYSLNPGDLTWKSIEQFGEMTIYDRTDSVDVVERCRDAEIVLTNKVPLTKDMFSSLPSLRFIGVLATGYNIIDTFAARQAGIVVSNIPAYSTSSVVQMTLALLLSITNRVEHYTQQIVHEQRWTTCKDFCYWDTPLPELEGKRFGIYGYGQIGSRVGKVASAMGMKVVCHTRKSQSMLPFDVQKITGEEFWQSCDIVSLHCPLTDDTRGLVNYNRIDKMPSGAILLNTSRGPIINECDVAQALAEGKLSAYGTDVASVEPIKSDNPLLTAPNVFITPHIAWATKEARTRLMGILMDNIRAFINGNPINVVN